MIRKNPISFFTILGLFVLMLLGRCWKPNPNPISWDAAGYYLYLPAQFIHHDLALNNYATFDSLRNQYQFSSSFYQVHPAPSGKNVIKYTMGNSVLYAPFFFIGHMVAKITHQPQDGFSKPYQLSLLWGTFIYGLLALWFARKILLHFFNDATAAITLLGIVLGTNLFIILSMDNLQTHYNLFFLYTLLIWCTIQFHQQPSWKHALYMGACGGMIILVRPTDIVSWLIPLGWGIGSLGDVFYKIRYQFKYFVLFFCVAGLLFFPQLLYWKTFAGEWLYNSYDNAGEGLDLFSPHTIPFLFSYRKGWLVYTPMVILIIIGIFMSIRSKQKVFLPVLLFFVFNLWLVSSWTCWWYANGFSSRAMVQSYAVLMIPLGFFVHYLIQKKGAVAFAGKTVFLLVTFLCVFQTWQYAQRILKFDRMTKAYYWKVFGSTKVDPSLEKYVLKDKFLGTDTIVDPENFVVTNVFEVGAKDSLVPMMDSTKVFFTLLEREYQTLTNRYYAYVRVEGELQNACKVDVELIRTMIHEDKLYAYSSKNLNIQSGQDSLAWQAFTVDYIFPDVRNETDKFKAYLWLRGPGLVLFRNLEVQILEARSFPELE